MFSIFEFKNADETIKEKIQVYIMVEESWFRGGQVAKVLGYSHPADAIARHVESDDKITIKKLLENIALIGVDETRTPTKCDPQTIFINEPGLYSLIMSSKLPLAKEFKKWVTTEVLPTIRKTGKYDLTKQKEFEKLPKLMIDINQYLNNSCVYILHIKDGLYKFGVTDDIKRRLADHLRDLKYEDIIKIYRLDNYSLCKDVENKIKSLIRQLNINTKYNGSVEFFETNEHVDLKYVLTFVDRYIDEVENTSNDSIEFKKYEADKQREFELEKYRIDKESNRITEVEKFKIESNRITEIEKYKLDKKQDKELEKQKINKDIEKYQIEKTNELKIKYLQSLDTNNHMIKFIKKIDPTAVTTGYIDRGMSLDQSSKNCIKSDKLSNDTLDINEPINEQSFEQMKKLYNTMPLPWMNKNKHK
jgi:prophage antirepressor-like protein/predicted GIY-YIG superfamily endonuclease